jgi:hypothetical protein
MTGRDYLAMFVHRMKRVGGHSLYFGGLLPAAPLAFKVSISIRQWVGGGVTCVAGCAMPTSAYCGESQLFWC